MRPAIRKRIIAYSIFLALCVGLWSGIRENYKPDYGGALAPIIKAARDGNIDELQAILEQAEVSIEYRGAFSATPLVWAAFHGETEAVDFLLNRGADINSGDMNNRTALDWAILNNHEDTAQLLRNHMARILVLDDHQDGSLYTGD